MTFDFENPSLIQRFAAVQSIPKNMPRASREEFHEMSGVLAASLG